MVKTAIILAGGLGTRLKKVNPILPKPLASIQDRPFLEYLLDYWIDQGITRFIMSVCYQSQMIIDQFGRSYKGASIQYRVEELALGTGGGLLISAKGLNEPFIVLNGDTFFEVDLNELYFYHEKNRSEWTISLFRTNNFQRYMPLELSSSGLITKTKRKNQKSTYLANGGVYLISPSALKGFKKIYNKKISLEGELLPKCLKNGKALYGLEFSTSFIDIGIPEDYYRAQEFFSHK